MALEKVHKILEMAEQAHTSVMAYICIDYNMVYSAITIAEELQKPVIIMLLPEHCITYNVAGVAGFAAMVRELALGVKVPVGLHLDHSSDYAYIIRAVQQGFPSVMIDGSMFPYEENIRLTKKVCEAAHVLGADVEAELGHVGLAMDDAACQEEFYTNPETAASFCTETGVDSLTVAIGNAHGTYKKSPRLDIERLVEIDRATDVPLVLHGGSGIPDDQLKQAFAKGINKFNVGTEYLACYYKSMEEYVKMHEGEEDPLCMLGFSGYAQERLMEYLRKKMSLSGL
ncbi:class II fructose-bisphosphate aldolase [Diplocloster hominis]|uniref:class II fructose-bisphosphate aldolase n=1 Tax=Diplocloster hominis TaxID=3079010 RepID=UPI0031BB6CD3